MWEYSHYVKSVQIRSYFWSAFSCILIEYGPEITPHLDIFQAESVWLISLSETKNIVSLNTFSFFFSFVVDSAGICYIGVISEDKEKNDLKTELS